MNKSPVIAVLSAYLILTTFIAQAFCLKSDTRIYISPSQICRTEYAPSVEFTIRVVVENVSQMKILSFNLSYNPQVISYRGHLVEYSENLESIQFTVKDQSGFLFVNISLEDDLTCINVTNIVAVTFHVLERGRTFINLTVLQLEDSAGNPLPYTSFSGYFSNLNPYDLNEDGKIDIMDVAIVAYSLGSYPGHPRWNPDADVNGDGEVDIRDVVLVASYFGSY